VSCHYTSVVDTTRLRVSDARSNATAHPAVLRPQRDGGAQRADVGHGDDRAPPRPPEQRQFPRGALRQRRYETFDDTDTHARIFLRWLREGVSNALVKRYLKDVTLVVMREDRVSVIETFVFAVDYTTAGEVNLTTTGTGRLPVTRSFLEEGLQCLIGSLEEHLGTLPPLPPQVSFALQLCLLPGAHAGGVPPAGVRGGDRRGDAAVLAAAGRGGPARQR
jgi:hypothetical protein